jgi:hypothetical protein
MKIGEHVAIIVLAILIAIGAIMLGVWILVPRVGNLMVHWRHKKIAKKDRKTKSAFVDNHYRQEPHPYRLDPLVPSNDENLDLESALCSIPLSPSCPVSDLALRNAHISPASSRTVVKNIDVPPNLHLEGKDGSIKPLVIKGVPMEKFRSRNSSRTASSHNGNLCEAHCASVQDEGVDKDKQTSHPQPLDEHDLQTDTRDAGYNDKRASVASEVTHITTGASIGQAMSMAMHCVSTHRGS